MRFGSLVALAVCGFLATNSFAAERVVDKEPRLTKPDSQGRFLYIINLNPEAVEGEDARDELAARNPMDNRNAVEFRAWHRPKVRALVKRLENEYGIEAKTMTSHALPTFSAYVTESVIGEIRRDPRVDSVQSTYEAADFSQAPPWVDQAAGGELIPWGKTAIGTNDTVSTANVVYMLDAGMPPANNDLLNVIATPVNQAEINFPDHASHVAGILSAAMNGTQVRGVNPGATVFNVNRGLADNVIQQAMDWVLADSETRGIFPIVNISSSSARWAAGHPSGLAGFVRRLSNRALVVQSAGNNRELACDVAHGPAKANDGILVVSGVDEAGQQAIPFDNTAVPNYGFELGAARGSCVEMWAPAQRVFSTWNTGVAAIQRLAGTSMAAPHVAALAARFGTSTTSPVERESYLRARLRNTGFNDEDGTAIIVPSYLQAPSFVVPIRLWNLSAIASNTGSGSPAYTHDGRYLSGNMWNSGQFAPAWIEFDLVYPRTLASIRLTPEINPAGTVTHEIYVGNTTPPTTLATAISGSSQILVPMAANLGAVARYVRVLTTASPSWVAWREVEIYATLRTDETTVDWFYLGLLNRTADAGGYVPWLNQLRVARCSDPGSVQPTLNTMTSGFTNSPEFLARGLSNQAYVIALYKGLLRRDPDPAGLANHTFALDSGALTREDVRVNFVFSTEFANETVARVMSETCTSI